VDQETFQRLAQHYSEREICEIVWLVASEHLYNMTNIGLNIHSICCAISPKGNGTMPWCLQCSRHTPCAVRRTRRVRSTLRNQERTATPIASGEPRCVRHSDNFARIAEEEGQFSREAAKSRRREERGEECLGRGRLCEQGAINAERLCFISRVEEWN